jgi:hypothetical protein
VMSLLRVLTAVIWLLAVACEAVPSDHPPLRRMPFVSPEEESSDPDLSFPGGGRILFFAPDSGGIGFVEANGALRRVPRSGHLTFPYWDPVAPDHVLTLSNGSRSDARSYEIERAPS